MNNKERGLAPFKRLGMDRFPMWYGADPEFTRNLVNFLGATDEDNALYDILDMDYMTIRPVYSGGPLKKYPDGSVDTIWGVRRNGYYYGMSVSHPMESFETVEQVTGYKFPDPNDFNVDISNEQKKKVHDHCLIGGTWAPFFHDSVELRGMERFFIDMYENPSLANAIVEKCFEFYHELDRRTFEKYGDMIDMYFIGNDFGSQRQLLMPPELWRKFYKPYLKKLIEQARSYGCVTAVHSCGSIRSIIPDLLDIGVDAINPIQVNAEQMDPEALVNEFGSDAVFFGGIDENNILMNATPEKVREETRRIIDILGKHGRYIVAPSHDYLIPEVPAVNVAAMYDEAQKYGLGALFSLQF